jgi:Heterokaryon incompatibility protein Het-C
MSARKCATVFAIVLLSAGYAHAFIIGIHATITRAGLFSTVLEFGLSPNVLMDLDGKWFTGQAIREIVRADITRDTGDCSHTPLGVPDDTPAIPCGPSFDIDRTIDDTNRLQTFLSASGYAFENASAEHFDDELFQLGNGSILIARNAALSALKSKNFVGARKQVGYALHTVQDFYAHTNYIDLGNDCCVNRLGFEDAFSMRGGKVFLQGLRIADKADMTCSDPSTLLTDDVEYLKSRLGPLTDRPLTSGYFPNTRSEIKTYHKCAHGLSIIGFEHGINKDDTTSFDDRHNARHEKAMEVAQMHTANFVKGVLTDGCGSDADCVAGFLGYPRISSLEPTSANAGQAVFYLQVMGAGFGTADFKPTVMWNGRALETNVISNTRLDARVETANLATGGKIKIRVQQFDVDEDTGNVNSTLLQSNAMDFTVNGLTPTPAVDEGDCPGKIHPHHHDKNYLDVNANRWNDTGYAVVEGQTLNFELVPGGSIVWRAGGLLTPGTGEAGPDGDPRATPATTLLWADPQIDYRKVSIGALIGMVVDTDHLDSSLNPKIPLIEKPVEGVKYFPIGSGGRGIGPIPATGRLYLGVNDGVFYNNGGCFQVRVTSPAKR